MYNIPKSHSQRSSAFRVPSSRGGDQSPLAGRDSSHHTTSCVRDARRESTASVPSIAPSSAVSGGKGPRGIDWEQLNGSSTVRHRASGSHPSSPIFPAVPPRGDKEAPSVFSYMTNGPPGERHPDHGHSNSYYRSTRRRSDDAEPASKIPPIPPAMLNRSVTGSHHGTDNCRRVETVVDDTSSARVSRGGSVSTVRSGRQPVVTPLGSIYAPGTKPADALRDEYEYLSFIARSRQPSELRGAAPSARSPLPQSERRGSNRQATTVPPLRPRLQGNLGPVVGQTPQLITHIPRRGEVNAVWERTISADGSTSERFGVSVKSGPSSGSVTRSTPKGRRGSGARSGQAPPKWAEWVAGRR